MNDARHFYQGDWVARLCERARERGHGSLTAFADANPTLSLDSLAKELGKDDLTKEDITGSQVRDGLLEEAERHNQVAHFVRDQFVRLCAQWLPEGWPAVMAANHDKIGEVYGRWSLYTPKTHKVRVIKAKYALHEAPPPPGWRPLGPDDELLLTLLPDEKV